MTQIVVFPDIEAWLIAYLDAALTDRTESYTDDVLVTNETDADDDAVRSVIIRRDGGPQLDRVRELARMSVRVFAANDADATDLANMVRALIAACPDGKPVSRAVEQSGPTPVPDARSPLRLLVVDLTVRASRV